MLSQKVQQMGVASAIKVKIYYGILFYSHAIVSTILFMIFQYFSALTVLR